MWRFRRSCRRTFLNSLAAYCPPVAVYANGLGQLLETVFKWSLAIVRFMMNDSIDQKPEVKKKSH